MLYGVVILGLPLFVVGATFGHEYDTFIKARKRRKIAITTRQSNPQAPLLLVDRQLTNDKSMKNFAHEYQSFQHEFQRLCPHMGMSFELGTSWLDSMRAALLEHVPGTALDKLSALVLSRLADAEEEAGMVSMNSSEPCCQRALVCCRSCRQVRLSWHKLCVTCCQLAAVPPSLLTNLAEELAASTPLPATDGGMQRQDSGHAAVGKSAEDAAHECKLQEEQTTQEDEEMLNSDATDSQEDVASDAELGQGGRHKLAL